MVEKKTQNKKFIYYCTVTTFMDKYNHLLEILERSRRKFDEVYKLVEEDTDTIARLVHYISTKRETTKSQTSILSNPVFDSNAPDGLVGCVTGFGNIAFNAEVEAQNAYINALLIMVIRERGLESHGQEIIDGLNISLQPTYPDNRRVDPHPDGLSGSISSIRLMGNLRLRAELDYIDRWVMYYKLFADRS